ncbi:MAG TPA: PQQ-binding-like beta-propeller repeat protein [Terriglobia bacterium]|nr:PQQ-binding-like beta-propeller repeat protein [Terriglobia bacterium]
MRVAMRQRQSWLAAGSALFAVFSSLAILWGQTPASQQQAHGSEIYAKQCSGCHGLDARGGEHGPPLAGNSKLRGRSISWLRRRIHDGIPTGGMPAFSNLPASELDALAALVHSLNSPAAQNSVSGDRAAGEAYFFGEGQCASCHMVYGKGSAVGPDLSDVGREFSAEEIRASLLNPSEHITPGYQMVTAHLHNGKTVRGFGRSRSNFEAIVQDLKGHFYMLPMDQISDIDEDQQSQMPPVKASTEQLQNLIAFLSSLAGVKPGVALTEDASPGDGGVPFSRILRPRPGDWLTYNGDLSGNRYSKLGQINTSNVNQLRLKWIFTVPLWKQLVPDNAYFHNKMEHFGVETTPIVADGIMYGTGPHQAFALDARTGQEIWDYRRPRPPELNVGDAALGTNRGVAILGDKVFKVTQNAHLLALNRTTGKPVWEVVMPPKELTNYGSTVAPLIVKDMVIAGVSGGDWPGVRGFVAVYRASNGQLVWRRRTIPDDGDPEAATWGGKLPKNVGGGATWVTGSYDPETDTLYWTTGNPYPDSNGSIRPGDNLYANCILALNPESGKVKWYYQVTPRDIHDWDATAPLVLVDTNYQGQPRKLLLFTNKNGFFYVLDRTNGHVLAASPFVRVTWASGIGADGRPQLLPESGPVCPIIGTNWNAKVFSPVTRLYYVMALDGCTEKVSSRRRKSENPKAEPARKYLRAIDIDTGKTAWEVEQFGSGSDKDFEEQDSGILATAGGLLFYGDLSGNVVAADARNGKALWRFPTSGLNKASPMTYTVNGKQYVALTVGPNILCFGLP